MRLHTGVLFLAFTVAFATTSAGGDGPEVRKDFRTGGQSMFIDPDSHQNLSGHTSDLTVNPNNFCFGSTSDSSFSGGELASFNVFWDALSTGGVMSFDVTWAVQLPSGEIKGLLRRACNYDLSSVPPGSPVSFCCALSQPVPSVSFSGPWGSRVIFGDSLQGPLGTVIVTP